MCLLSGVLSPSTSHAEDFGADFVLTETNNFAFEGCYGGNSSIRREHPRPVVQY